MVYFVYPSHFLLKIFSHSVLMLIGPVCKRLWLDRLCVCMESIGSLKFLTLNTCTGSSTFFSFEIAGMALQMHLSSEICDSQSASFHPLNWLNSRTDYAKRVCVYAFFPYFFFSLLFSFNSTMLFAWIRNCISIFFLENEQENSWFFFFLSYIVVVAVDVFFFIFFFVFIISISKCNHTSLYKLLKQMRFFLRFSRLVHWLTSDHQRITSKVSQALHCKRSTN